MGFAIGDPGVVDRVSRVSGPYDINSFAVTAALAALADQSYVDAYVQQVGQARDWLVQQFRAGGVRHHAAGGNYLLVWPKQGPALVEARLREAGILVRSMEGKPLISGSLRVSIGTPEQMQRFWAAYAAIEHPSTEYPTP
jgi:histidinol-phosphate aminotransferase